jgi:hypothetical protein
MIYMFAGCTCQQGIAGPPVSSLYLPHTHTHTIIHQGPPGADGRTGNDGTVGIDGQPGRDVEPTAKLIVPDCVECEPSVAGEPGPVGPKGPKGRMVGVVYVIVWDYFNLYVTRNLVLFIVDESNARKVILQIVVCVIKFVRNIQLCAIKN